MWFFWYVLGLIMGRNVVNKFFENLLVLGGDYEKRFNYSRKKWKLGVVLKD